MNIQRYKSIVFDCDGVVLNSNHIKTKAFYQAALPYGELAAQALVEYHVSNGGVSRYNKFSYFMEQIVPKVAPLVNGPDFKDLLENYASSVREGLLTCEAAEGLHEVKDKVPTSRWFIVSGGDQAELRDVFTRRGLSELFNGGIYGSPDTKDDILAREMANGNIQAPVLFFGDSKYDYLSASRFGLDFVFLSEWSEFEGYDVWCADNSIACTKNLRKFFMNLE